MDSEKDEPQKNSKDNKDRSGWWQVGVAILAAVVAAVAGGFSWLQASQAKQQNIVSEQQALVTLVSAIAQSPQSIAQESGAFKGNQAALANAVAGTNFTELTDSEEAYYLIRLLNGAGVTAIEYYETALGLEASESYTRALNLLNSAVSEATNDSDPRTLANAWEAEAIISYNSGNYSSYSHDLMNAQNAYLPSLGATHIEYERNLVYLKFFDASYKAGGGNCLTAWTEIKEAYSILAKINSSQSTADSSIDAQVLKECPSA